MSLQMPSSVVVSQIDSPAMARIDLFYARPS